MIIKTNRKEQLYAFVQYRFEKDGKEALEKLNGAPFKDAVLATNPYINTAAKRIKNGKPKLNESRMSDIPTENWRKVDKRKDDLRCALYVKGFPGQVSKAQLSDKFSEIAEVVRVDIHMNKH